MPNEDPSYLMPLLGEAQHMRQCPGCNLQFYKKHRSTVHVEDTLARAVLRSRVPALAEAETLYATMSRASELYMLKHRSRTVLTHLVVFNNI